MGNSRLGLSFVAVLLMAGMGTACKKGQAATGLDPATGPPAKSSDHDGFGNTGKVHQLIRRPPIDIVPADKMRRDRALALFNGKELGLLHESSSEKLEEDRAVAAKALRETIADLPAALSRTFGPETAAKISREYGFKESEAAPTCLHSACFVDVYFRSWVAFDALNQLFKLDQALPWNNYPATRYRSARAELESDPRWQFVVTWALVLPLNDKPAVDAYRVPKSKGGKR